MPLDYSNPQVLKFLIENYERVQEKRTLWFHKNKEAILKAAEFPDTYENLRSDDVRRVPLDIYMPIFAKDFQNDLVNHRRKVIADRPATGLYPVKLKTKETPCMMKPPKTVMLPVDPNVKSIHNQCLPVGGRVQYLKTRNHKSPEEKYYFDETTSHVYGWGLKDSKLASQAPEYGRYCTFIHDLSSRSGPHPDPDHYQKLPNHPYSKC